MTFCKYIIIYLFALQLLVPLSLSPDKKQQPITYRQLLKQVSLKNPAIRSGQMDVLEKEWLWRQSKSWSNPDVEIELENFGGSENFGGTDSGIEEEPSELTATLSQQLELGGKRGKRKKMARFTWDRAKVDSEQLKLDVLQAASQGFVTLLAAQELEQQAKEFHQQSLEMHRIVKIQVEVGKVSPLILKKADVLLADSAIKLKQAKQQRLNARQRLTAFRSDGNDTFEQAAGSLAKRYSLPSKSDLWKQVEASPEIRGLNITEELGKTAVSLEKAAVIPDLEITGGIRKMRQVQGHKWVAALSFQLPLLNFNRGNIKAAQYRLQKDKALAKDTLNNLRAEFEETYNQWTTAGDEATILEKKSLASLEELYNGTLEGYKAGKFSFIEVLDARQTLNRTKQRYIKVLRKFHLAALKLARMTGTTLDKLPGSDQPF